MDNEDMVKWAIVLTLAVAGIYAYRASKTQSLEDAVNDAIDANPGLF